MFCLYANTARVLLTTTEKEMQPVNLSTLVSSSLMHSNIEITMEHFFTMKKNTSTERENITQSLSNVLRLTCFILGSSAKPLGLDRAVKCLTMCLKASDFPDPLSPLVRKQNRQSLVIIILLLQILSILMSVFKNP